VFLRLRIIIYLKNDGILVKNSIKKGTYLSLHHSQSANLSFPLCIMNEVFHVMPDPLGKHSMFFQALINFHSTRELRETKELVKG